MAILFENIDTKETYAIDRKKGGQFYRAKLSALINSSNMSVNSDRGQDFGVRLVPEQQALIEQWEQDPQMIDKVSSWSRVMVDDLTHAEFLSYLLYQQELGMSPERSQDAARRTAQQEYEARVAAIRAQDRPEPMAPFNSKVARGEETIDDFLNGDLTGDAGGDKVAEDELSEEDQAAVDKLVEDGNQTIAETHPVRPFEAEKPKATRTRKSKTEE